MTQTLAALEMRALFWPDSGLSEAFLFLDLPSGKQPHKSGKSPFLLGKSTISMAIFNSYVTNYQRVKTNTKSTGFRWFNRENHGIINGKSY